jgi:sn-glycerol 3-phosphate transport system permease protein
MGKSRKNLRALCRKGVDRLFRSPYALILPAFILCVCFSIVPTAITIRNSFYKVDYVAGVDSFVGLANFSAIFTDKVFLRVFGNTIAFTFFTLLLAIPLALLIGVFLNQNRWIYNFTQGVVFTPHIISFVSVATLWMFLMDPQFGVLNYLLGLFGIQPLRWLLGENTSLLSIVIVSVWKTVGYNVLIVVAALQGIPREVYESARLDRSGPVKTFFFVTLPMISSSLVFLVTTSIIQTFNTFDLVKIMTRGGPKNSSSLLVYWIYETGYLHFQVGKAMAGAVVLLFFVALLSFSNFFLMNRRAHYQ